jgi:hypothetical protein
MENSSVMPLSEYEERMIAEFERQFSVEEPVELPTNLDARRVVQVGLVGVGAGFVIMLAALSISVLLSFAGFLLCFASAYWCWVGVRQGGWDQLMDRYRKPVPRRRSTDL